MFKKVIVSLIALSSVASVAQAHSLLPDLKTAKYPLYDRAIDHNTLPGRALLRFSNGVANIGRGRMEIKGGPVLENGNQKVYQRIYSSHGGYTTRVAGEFQYHPEHNHVHFNDFAHYKLRRIIGSTGVGSIVAQSDKVSFCLEDSSIYTYRVPGFRPYRRYTTCASTTQGISIGWLDMYGKWLPGQWIDVTDVPEGMYWLESTADPRNRLKESNETNNTTRVKVLINH